MALVLPDLDCLDLRDVMSKEKKFWLWWIGSCERRKLVSVVSQFWETAQAQYFVEFSCQIINEQQVFCDFYQEKSPSYYEHLQAIRFYENHDPHVAGDVLYIFMFQVTTVPWRLAVTTAADALLVC